MSDDTTRASRGGTGMKGAIAWIAILGLVAVVTWLVSERNARQWFLVPSEGRLVVMKGLTLPVGRTTFETSDPTLAQAYAPLVPPPGKTLPPERAFEERGLLDQAIYDLVAGWAREEIASGDPARLERGLGYVARAEKLPGLSPAQRDDLSALRAESAYQEGLKLVGKAADELRDAAERLRRAAGSRSPHAGEASVLLRDVEPVAEAATLALRKAAAAPPPSRPAAPPAEAPATPAPDQAAPPR
jgi:hypothetical protein